MNKKKIVKILFLLIAMGLILYVLLLLLNNMVIEKYRVEPVLDSEYIEFSKNNIEQHLKSIYNLCYLTISYCIISVIIIFWVDNR